MIGRMSAQPIAYESDYVERRSRLTTFFRLLLAIPSMVVAMVYGIGVYVAVVVAWFILLFTGRWPEGLYRFVAGTTQYFTRLNAYCYLLTDAYPPFDLGEHGDYPVRLRIGPPKASYSRLKVLFRIILVIPVAIIAYVMGLIAQLGGFLAWFAIVITGKQPRSLQNMTDLGVAYMGRATAYYFLVTEDWPPIGIDPAPGGDASTGPEAPLPREPQTE